MKSSSERRPRISLWLSLAEDTWVLSLTNSPLRLGNYSFYPISPRRFGLLGAMGKVAVCRNFLRFINKAYSEDVAL